MPVIFTADGKRWRVKPDSVLVDVDWAAAVEAAHRQGEGFGPLRGLKRLGVRVFGGEVVADDARLRGGRHAPTSTRFAKAVDRPRVEPSLRLRGPRGGSRARPKRPAARPEAAQQVLVALADGLLA